MLTNALNKSPKPPIIVDDIIVTELNLGDIPPELEILEVGDLGVDRFRGIFKLQYSGDAFLTLKTRVQANPLNTYLSAKPSFASPQPLAAASSLTIPLQITLSDFRLSGFVILVFSRQKGITLVFRNDPLDSLKVSSTFDSIPFVRDYLQREIEGQLRVLFMEDLPAIIHRLSLRLWVPDHASQEEGANTNHLDHPGDAAEPPIDPLASPSQIPRDPADRHSHDIEPSPLSLNDESGETEHPSFSQKNLLRLAALNESHRTLSLFTPTLNDVVFRASAGAMERGDYHNVTGITGFSLANLPRQYNTTSLPGSAHSSDGVGGVPSVASAPTRPGLLPRAPASTSGHSFANTSFGLGASSRPRGSRPARKRKHRVVDLRRPAPADASDRRDRQAQDSPTNSRPSTPTSTAPSSSSQYLHQYSSGSVEREGELITPPDSPESKLKHPTPPQDGASGEKHPHTPRASRPAAVSPAQKAHESLLQSFRQMREQNEAHDESALDEALFVPKKKSSSSSDSKAPPYRAAPFPFSQEPDPFFPQAQQQPASSSSVAAEVPFASAQPGGILEQAWMIKMAREIARKVEVERERTRRERQQSASRDASGLETGKGELFPEGDDAEREAPPPAYAA